MRLSVNEAPKIDEKYLAELSSQTLLEVADLYLVQYDIILAQQHATTIFENSKNENPDSSSGRWIVGTTIDRDIIVGNHGLIADDNFHSLWWIALILYARCFIGGNRINLKSEDVFENENDRINHEYFYEMRNKHIAHPINNLEISKPFIQLPSLSEKESNRGKSIELIFGIMHARLTIDSIDKINCFINLCGKVRKYLSKIIDEKINDGMKDIISLNYDELYSMPYISIKIPDKDNTVSNGRPQRKKVKNKKV